jgi:transcriptional regulator with XRE-family HTH domain
MTADSLQHRVGTSIRRRREALGFSQDGFAAHIGMHRAYYSALERGEKNLTLGTLQRLCRGLEVSPSDILREAD